MSLAFSAVPSGCRILGAARCKRQGWRFSPSWRNTVKTQSGRLVQQHLDWRAFAFWARQREPQQRQLEWQTERQQQLRGGCPL